MTFQLYKQLWKGNGSFFRPQEIPNRIDRQGISTFLFPSFGFSYLYLEESQGYVIWISPYSSLVYYQHLHRNELNLAKHEGSGETHWTIINVLVQKVFGYNFVFWSILKLRPFLDLALCWILIHFLDFDPFLDYDPCFGFASTFRYLFQCIAPLK